MNEITTVGLDLAKRVVSLCGEDAAGRIVLRRTLRREAVLGGFAQRSPCLHKRGGRHFRFVRHDANHKRLQWSDDRPQQLRVQLDRVLWRDSSISIAHMVGSSVTESRVVRS